MGCRVYFSGDSDIADDIRLKTEQSKPGSIIVLLLRRKSPNHTPKKIFCDKIIKAILSSLKYYSQIVSCHCCYLFVWPHKIVSVNQRMR